MLKLAWLRLCGVECEVLSYFRNKSAMFYKDEIQFIGSSPSAGMQNHRRAGSTQRLLERRRRRLADRDPSSVIVSNVEEPSKL